ncbi:MAG TPA: hypothetical protein VGM64_16815 [Lacunisphaera sp.]|jgi:YVTN family beta-propeller protein
MNPPLLRSSRDVPLVHAQLQRSIGARTLLAGIALLGVMVATCPLEAAEASGPRLLVANKGDHTLGLIDPVAGKQIAVVAEDGITGHEVIASSDGQRAFVPIYGNSGVGGKGTDGRLIRVIDLARREIVGTIDLGKGLRPHCAMIGPKNGRLYVTTELAESVTVIDPATLKITGSISTGQPQSHMLALTHDGRRGYTANVGPGTVSVLDLENEKLISVIPVAKHIQRIALSVDDQRAFTSDQAEPRIAVIDTATNKVASWIALPGIGFSTAATPDGRWLLATIPGKNQVAVIDLHSMEVSQVLALPRAPQEVLMRPDGAVAYVSCDATRQVAAIDLEKMVVAQMIDAGAGADGLAWVPASKAD